MSDVINNFWNKLDAKTWEERLKEDQIIQKRMQFLEWQAKTPEEKRELQALHYKYYNENHDIRMYWKTY
jgi:hypothetical protein